MTSPEADYAWDNLLWTRALIDELARAGVRHVCVSPGARSTPLSLAVAERSDLATSVHVDERSAGFFALGYGRATGGPAALVCTSGTAAANYLPAIIEAHYSRVPLVVLTADRPPELRDTGAWQAIDQIKLYGGYVRWFVDVPTPSAEPTMLRYVRSLASRAVAVARGRPAGPVHLNCPFREPFAPDLEGEASGRAGDEQGSLGRSELLAVSGRPAGAPWVTAPRTTATAQPELLDELAERLARERNGLILAGPIHPPPGYAEAVARLAAASGYPILAEPAGGLRFGPHDRSHVVTGYDAFLRSERWAMAHAPSLVLRFGQSLTWKNVARFLEWHPGATQVIIDPEYTWDDPTRMAALRLPVDPVELCNALADRLESLGERDPGVVVQVERWFEEWREVSRVVARAVALMADGEEPGTVSWVYRWLMEALPDGALVYAANSMAVRDLDTFTAASDRSVRVIANRGAAGIDGTISSALGAAYGTGAPTVLVTGDLAFVHDLNGLGAARLPGLMATIVVLNDGGGGIFAHLPVAEYDREAFERFFLTSSGVDLAAACAAYGVPHVAVQDASAFGPVLGGRVTEAGVQVIEVPIDLEANTAAHRRLWSDVAAAVS